MDRPQGAGRTNGKAKIGMYWASGCGGCDISLLEIGPRLLELIEVADVVFWPCVADVKYRDVAAYPDEFMDVCLVNGSIRSSEQEEMARLLRKKSQTLVAYGTCAADGGIPALANLKAKREIYEAAYHVNPSIDNPGKVEPQVRTLTAYGALELPEQYDYVLRLRDVVDVDFEIPGCPPSADRVWGVLTSLLTGQVAAATGTVRVGCAADKAVCDECTREKRKTRIAKFRRLHEAIPEPGWCLLEQGFVCAGPATRAGCSAQCVKAGWACRGCYGPLPQVADQGAAMVGAVGSNLAATTEEAAQETMAGLVDPVGTFYRFTLASGLLHGRRESGSAWKGATAGLADAEQEELLKAADGGSLIAPGPGAPGGSQA